MQNPQPFAIRAVALDTDDTDALGIVQPERRRRYEQLHRGRFRGSLAEQAWGSAALMHERWNCGLRVRCDRPGGYVAFAVIARTEGDARWCGASVAPGTLLRVVEPWELSSSGSLELVSFGVGCAALDAVTVQLAGTEWAPTPGNRRSESRDGVRLVGRLTGMLRSLEAAAEPAALAAAEADLLRLAARLDLASDLAPIERLPHPSRRRAAVRRVEDYLDASANEVPSIPTLCTVARVSERTLEYAFREHLGITPVRFLKLRRLNRVRRELLAAEPGASVTGIALGAGIYDLGRFAGEYRQLFGEVPSHTLRQSAARGAGRSPPTWPAGPGTAAPGDWPPRCRAGGPPQRYALR
jgi:AraC family ethanolamine operon transcriptional activator